MSYRMALLVLSDSRASGEREDRVIPACRECLAGSELELVHTAIIPDDRQGIVRALQELVTAGTADLVITAGGTGLAPRDHAPEATRAVIEREAPGLAELVRISGRNHTPRAMLSRGVAGAAGRTLIINLPGSPQAVRQGLDALMPILPHALETLLGRARECAAGENRGAECHGGGGGETPAAPVADRHLPPHA